MMPTAQTGSAATARAGARLDTAALVAVAVILIGWFALSTLVTEFAGFRQGFPFYEMWALVKNPARLFTGIGADHLQLAVFGLLCIGALVGVFAPYRYPQRAAVLAYLIPLALMIACGILLYARASSDYLADDGRYGSLGSQVVHWANSAANRLGHAAARRVSIGLGGYLSFAASLFLAARGVLKYRRA
ncbi:MAG TPA: hypothetical protein VMG11_06560 [Steroidobacteraceae bacterium]|nr:hypothetical protein [Steroidobacteraceae bacterium]